MSSKILVVDDAADDLELVKAMLAASGFTVLTAHHGRDGLQKAKTQKPDLIISDVLMPEMDGFALFKELKKDPATSKIPVLILTVRGRMKDTFEAFGVECFMPKPFQAEALFSIINKYVAPQPQATAVPPAPKEEKKEAPAAAPIGKKDPAAAIAAKRKALIFGSDDHVLEKMINLLEKEKCHAVSTKDEAQLPVQADTLEPDLILLQLNGETVTPVDRIVKTLDSLLKKKIKIESSDTAASRKGNIVLYKVEEELHGVGSVGANIADTESLVERCTEEGCKKYIGSFSPALFISKIREFII